MLSELHQRGKPGVGVLPFGSTQAEHCGTERKALWAFQGLIGSLLSPKKWGGPIHNSSWSVHVLFNTAQWGNREVEVVPIQRHIEACPASKKGSLSGTHMVKRNGPSFQTSGE